MINRILKVTLLCMAVCCSCAFSSHGQSADCTATFKVSAGPDIYVCEGGQVNLNGFIGDDATRAEWIGGKGEFVPDRSALNAHYVPAISESGEKIILTLKGSNPEMPSCPSVSDDIEIQVTKEVKADAGPDMKWCAYQPVELHGKVSGDVSVTTWISSGTGKFDNQNNLTCIYTPSADDYKKGACLIRLAAESLGNCAPDTAAMILTFETAPSIKTETEKKVEQGKSVSLTAVVIGASKVQWRTHGSGSFSDADNATTQYTPSAVDSKNGSVILTLTAFSSNGKCTTVKDVTVYITPVGETEKKN